MQARTPHTEPRHPVVAAGTSKAIQRISQTEGKILEAVAHYRFLTAHQLMRLGVTSDKTHLYDKLRTLKTRRPALLHELRFGPEPGLGRLASIYFLTEHGAAALAHMTQRSRGS